MFYTFDFMKQFLKIFVSILLSLFILLCISIGILVLIVLTSSKSSSSELQADKILYLDLKDGLSEVNNTSQLDKILGNNAPLTTYQTINILEQAAQDDRIKGVVLNGTMNITPSQTEELTQALEYFKTSDKFIYAYGGHFNQNSYILCSAADSIFMNPMGYVDLKGYAMAQLYFKDFLEQNKLTPEIFVVGKYKSFVENFTRNNMSEENRKQISSYIGDLQHYMVETIHKNRQLEKATVELIIHNNLTFHKDSCLAYNIIDSALYKSDFEILLSQKTGLKPDKLFLPAKTYFQMHMPKKKGLAKTKIALLQAAGEITNTEAKGTISEQNFRNAFKAIRKDKKIKALLLRMDSPGGSALVSEELHHEIMLCKEAGIPVIVSVAQYAASGGYMMACHADKIFSNENSIVGSIGAFGVLFNTENFLEEKLNIHVDAYSTGPYAIPPNIITKLSDVQKARLQFQIEDIYSLFKSRVALGRGLDIDAVEEVAQGQIFSGKTGLKNALIDTIGTLQDALQFTKDQYDLTDSKVELFPKSEKNISEEIQALMGNRKFLQSEHLQIVDRYKMYLKNLQEGPFFTRMPFWEFY